MGLHLLVWALVGLLAAGWSLLCWAAHAVIAWDGWRRGLDWAEQVPKIDLPPWLADWLGLQWVEWLREQLVEWGPELQAWLSGLPDLSGWASLLVWSVWGLGLFFLMLGGAGVSGLIALVRRSSPRPQIAPGAV